MYYAAEVRILSLFVGTVLLLACPGAGSGEQPPAGVGTVSEPGCRALINVVGQPVDATSGRPDPEAAVEHFVVDLRIGARTRAETGSGLVVRAGSDAYALELPTHESSDTGPDDTSMERAWNDVVATTLPGGEPVVWIYGEPELVFPPPGRYPYEDYRFHSVIGIFGPYVSIKLSTHDYLGGPHGSTGATFLMVRAPTGEVMSGDFMGPKAMTAVVAAVAKESERRSDGGDSGDSDLIPPDDLAKAGLSFDSEGRLQVSVALFCCSWAENHNLLQIDAPLLEVPAALESYLTLSKAPESLIEAPDGCGAVGFDDGELVARRPVSGALIKVDLTAFRPQSILGVYWLDPDDPFSTTLLAGPARP